MKSFCQNNLKQKNRGAFKALCFLLLFSVNSFAESGMDTIILTNEISIDPLNRTSISESEFAFISANSWNIEKREMSINKLNISTHVLKSIKVKIPTSIKILQCPTFCLNDSYLLIQDEYELDWFLFKNVAGEFKFLEKINLPKKTMAFEAKVLNDRLFLLTDLYNHHPLDSTFNSTLCVYDAKVGKIVKTIHPEIPCIGLSHFPHNWISQNKHFIALAEPCGNRIQLYDVQLNFIRTVFLPDSRSWVNLKENKLPLESSPAKINPKSFIEEFSPFLTTFSRIKTIHFANDSLLMISCNHPDSLTIRKENYIYDAAKNKFLSPSAIIISKNDFSSISNKSTSSFNITPYQLIRNGICISLESDNFIPNSKLTIQENENNKNKFYQDNDPEFIIRISKIKVQ